LMLSCSIRFSARPSSGAFDVELQLMVFCTPIIRSFWCWVAAYGFLHAHHQEHLMLSYSLWFSVRPSLWAFDVELQHMVFCTPIIRSIRCWVAACGFLHVQKTICCNSTSNAPDDGLMCYCRIPKIGKT
jgi:hypothetical protein